MINLDKSDWRAKLFRFALQIWGEFGGRDWGFTDGTNLCHFARVICLYLPFVLFLHLALLGAAAWALVILPVDLFGWAAWGRVLGSAAIIALMFAVASNLISRLVDKTFRARPEAKKGAPPPPELEPKPALVRTPKGPSTWSIIWAWVKAAKQRVCPTVRFTASTQEVSHAA